MGGGHWMRWVRGCVGERWSVVEAREVAKGGTPSWGSVRWKYGEGEDEGSLKMRDQVLLAHLEV